MKTFDKADILLATYNGDKHLAELLDSLLSQSHQNLFIIVRDDGSTDTTCKILKEYSDVHPEKFKIITDRLGNLGPMKNFEKIAENSDANYVFFADQDDVWKENKVERCVDELKQLEQKYSAETPCLVFSDMHIADDNLAIRCPSYYEYCHKKAHKHTMKDLILQNIMLGCAQGFNKALLKQAFPIEKNVIMHDWWLAIVASALGKISYVEEPLLFYRQHAGNVIGARGPSLLTYKKMMPWSDKTSYTQHLDLIFQQAELLGEKYGDVLSKEQKEILKNFEGIQHKKFFGRLFALLKNGFYRSNIHETLEVIFRYSPK